MKFKNLEENTENLYINILRLLCYPIICSIAHSLQFEKYASEIVCYMI